MPKQSSYAARIQQEQEVSALVLKNFVGLSLKTDFSNRPNNSFQQLDNFDLYIPGSIRKVLPATLYNTHGAFPTNLLNCSEYLAQPNAANGGTRRILAVGANGDVYDVNTATPNVAYRHFAGGAHSPQTIPYLVQSSGFYVPYNMTIWQKNTAYSQYDAVLKNSPVDGKLYVYYVSSAGGNSGTIEPFWPARYLGAPTVVDNTVTWTNAGEPTSATFAANFMFFLLPGAQVLPRLFTLVEWQYDPNNGGETPKINFLYAGISTPSSPIQISGSVITPNLSGYLPSSGRAYLWTFYNPNTLEESAPSPFTGQTVIVETDNANQQTTINGSVLLPLPATSQAKSYSSYQSYYLSIPKVALTAFFNNGTQTSYPCIRVYATKDGGTGFFLVNTLFDNNGNKITNSDGSVSVALLNSLSVANGWTDYTPVPGSQPAQASVRVYEGSGPINYTPDPINLSADAWHPSPSGTSNPLYVASGAAPDGNNAIEYDDAGSGVSSAGPWSYYSAGMKLQGGTQYYVQLYMDKSQGTGGFMQLWVMQGTNVLLKLTQNDLTEGTKSGVFTPTGGGLKTIKLRVYLKNVTVAADQSLTWSDFIVQADPNHTGVLNATPTNYPTPDASLVIPAPAAGTNYPPPVAIAMEVFDDALFLVDAQDQTKIWYSNQNDFNKYGQNAFVRTTITKNADQILELIKCFDRLLVTKGRSVEQINSYPPSAPVAIDPQHGVMAKRASITWGSSILGLFNNGLGQMKLTAAVSEESLQVGMQGEMFGDDIKPIIDNITLSTLGSTNNGLELPCPTIFNKFNLFMLAYNDVHFAGPPPSNHWANFILMYYLGEERGFSRFTALPNGVHIITLKEVQDPASGQYLMLALCDDSNVYSLFSGTQDGTITATAITQPLPTPSDLPPELLDTDKIFRDLYFEGEDLSNFLVSFATEKQLNPDGTVASWPAGWANKQIINNSIDIGITSKQIIIRLTHAASTFVTPLISLMKINYDIEGAQN